MTISSFITPAVEGRVRKIGRIFRRHGFIGNDMEDLSAGKLGQAVAGGILSFNRQIGFPTTLAEIEASTGGNRKNTNGR